jgi:hypothetical protein
MTAERDAPGFCDFPQQKILIPARSSAFMIRIASLIEGVVYSDAG